MIRRPPPQAPTTVRTAAAAPARDDYLTIPQVIAELGVPRATFYRWRQLGRAPRSFRLPNGQVRIRRSALEEWVSSLGDDVA